MSFSGSRPTQARKMFNMALRCLAKALTTGVPVGTRGAYIGILTTCSSIIVNKTYLEHEAKDAENAVKAGIVRALSLPLNAGHHLGDKDEIDDQRTGQKGVLADVEDADSLMTTHEDFGIVLVQSTLVVATAGMYLMTTQWSGCSPSL